jgi:eukaryotic-like serine/threonine-protein kinase
MPEWIGKTIGNVRIEKLLARGGMAEVYLGTHLNLERPVAVKLLHSFIEEEPLLLERFHREAKVVAGLRHSNIVQIFDFATIDGHPYIVMEYLKGPTLAIYLRHLHQRKKRIAPDQIARLLNELSAALDYAHGQGVVHRDIKPGNILLHNRKEDIPLDKPLTDDVGAVITDFGLVRIMNTASQTASGTVSGTPAYMSPEQARGDPTDHRTDIYSLGIVLYEMLAGRVPFDADSTLTVLHMQIHTTPPAIPGIPAKVQAVLDRALLKNPDGRYQTSRELANDYSRSIGMTAQAETIREPSQVSTEPIEAPAPTEPEPPPKPAPIEPEPPSKPEPTEQKLTPKPARSRTWIGVGLFALVCLALIAFGAPRLLGALSNPSQSTETVNTVIPNTEISPLPSETLGLPSAEGMVQVPAGTYQVGKDPASQYYSPSQPIQLNDFWIDQYQTTNADYEQFLLANNGALTPMIWPPKSGEEKHPVRGVTWNQADAYCQWVSKRLPKEAEWEAAGRGPGASPRLYPWGDDPSAGGKTLNLPNQDTYEVGSQSFNVSPLKVYDMVGNVWEWVGDPYGSLEAGKKILRGSQFGNPLDLAFRLQVAPDDPNYVPQAGFRCAADQVK